MSKPSEIKIDEDSVTLLEGNELMIRCEHRLNNGVGNTPTWSKLGSTNFRRMPDFLIISDIHRKDAGNYKCEYKGYSRILSLNILCKNILVISLSYC